jgi:hypothetical protein
MRGAIPPLPQYVFMTWCLVKHRDNFYLLQMRACSLHREMKNVYKHLVGYPKEKRLLGKHRCRWGIILKCIKNTLLHAVIYLVKDLYDSDKRANRMVRCLKVCSLILLTAGVWRFYSVSPNKFRNSSRPLPPISIPVPFLRTRIQVPHHKDVLVKTVKLSLCLTKHHAIKTYWGSGDKASRILDFCTRWR